MDTSRKNNLINFIKQTLSINHNSVGTSTQNGEQILYYGLISQTDYQDILENKDIIKAILVDLIEEEEYLEDRKTLFLKEDFSNLLISSIKPNLIWDFFETNPTLLTDCLKTNNRHNHNILNQLTKNTLKKENQKKLINILKNTKYETFFKETNSYNAPTEYISETSALHIAFQSEHYDFCDFLIKYKFSFNDVDGEGNNIFFYINNDKQWEYLYNHSSFIDLKQQNKNGDTPIRNIVHKICHSSIGSGSFNNNHRDFFSKLTEYTKWQEVVLPYIIQYELYSSDKESFLKFINSLKNDKEINIKKTINQDVDGLSIFHNHLSIQGTSKKNKDEFYDKIQILIEHGLDLKKTNELDDMSVASYIIHQMTTPEQTFSIMNTMNEQGLFNDKKFLKSFTKDLYTQTLMHTKKQENAFTLNFTNIKNNHVPQFSDLLYNEEPLHYVELLKYKYGKHEFLTRPANFELIKNYEKKYNVFSSGLDPQKETAFGKNTLEKFILLFSQIARIKKEPKVIDSPFNYIFNLHSLFDTHKKEKNITVINDESIRRLFECAINSNNPDSNLAYCCFLTLNHLCVSLNNKSMFDIRTNDINKNNFSTEANTLSEQVKELEKKMSEISKIDSQPFKNILLENKTAKAVKIMEHLTCLNLEKLSQNPIFSKIFKEKKENIKNKSQQMNNDIFSSLINTMENHILNNQLNANKKVSRRTPRL